MEFDKNNTLQPRDIKEGMQAEYQMWGYDFKRLNSILEVVTEGFLMLASSPDYALTLTYALKEFYSAIRFLFLDHTKTEYDQRFKDILKFVKGELETYHKYSDMGRERPLNPEVYEKLDLLRDDLMDMRQLVGLGIPAQKKISKKNSLRGALTGE